MDTVIVAAISFVVGAGTIVLFVCRPLVKENQELQKNYGELDSKHQREMLLAVDRIMNDEH